MVCRNWGVEKREKKKRRGYIHVYITNVPCVLLERKGEKK